MIRKPHSGFQICLSPFFKNITIDPFKTENVPFFRRVFYFGKALKNTLFEEKSTKHPASRRIFR